MNEKGAIIIEGHIQGLSNTRSLGEKGIPVYVVDKNNCVARYSKYCRKFFICPDYNSREFIEFLIHLAIKENIRDWILVPSNDHAVYAIAKYKSELDEYFKTSYNELTVIENIYDKSKLMSIAKACGIPVPETYYFKDLNQIIHGNIKFPVLIKGRIGLTFYKSMGKKAFIAQDEIQLMGKLDRIKEVVEFDKILVQELIPFDGSNKTISFTAFCENGEIKTYWMGEKIREHPVRFGTATFARSIYEGKCFSQSVTLLKELNYNGICEVEYIRDPRDDRYKLIEINARSWLWTGLAKACGIDYAYLLHNSLLSRENTYPSKFAVDIKWINWFTDIPYSIISILRNKMGIREYFKSLRGDKIDAIWCSGDKKPFLSYLFLLPLFRLTR